MMDSHQADKEVPLRRSKAHHEDILQYGMWVLECRKLEGGADCCCFQPLEEDGQMAEFDEGPRQSY